MKRIYIKPVAEIAGVCTASYIAGSQTQWHYGNDKQGDDHTIGGDQPNPNQDAKGIYGYEDLWGDF